ncbi:MAG: hypothetical protein OXH11_09145 [Candidatus Aminicenantes bacterium]|nr:hypothetical protein [Candidatus Aminicenantes bacterium]
MKTVAGSILLFVLATSPMVWVVREAGSEPAASACPTHGIACCCPDACLKQLKTPDNGHPACARPARKPDRVRFVSDCGAEPDGIGFMNLKAVFLPPVRTGFGDLDSGLVPEAPLRTPLIPPVPDDPPPRSFS